MNVMDVMDGWDDGEQASDVFNNAIKLWDQIYHFAKQHDLCTCMKPRDIARFGGFFDGTNISLSKGLIIYFHEDWTPGGFLTKWGRWDIIHSHGVNTPAWIFFRKCIVEQYNLVKCNIPQGVWNYSNSSVPCKTFIVGSKSSCSFVRLPSLVYDDPRQLYARKVITEYIATDAEERRLGRVRSFPPLRISESALSKWKQSIALAKKQQEDLRNSIPLPPKKRPSSGGRKVGWFTPDDVAIDDVLAITKKKMDVQYGRLPLRSQNGARDEAASLLTAANAAAAAASVAAQKEHEEQLRARDASLATLEATLEAVQYDPLNGEQVEEIVKGLLAAVEELRALPLKPTPPTHFASLPVSKRLYINSSLRVVGGVFTAWKRVTRPRWNPAAGAADPASVY